MSDTRSGMRINWRQAAGEALLIFLGVLLALGGQAWWEARSDALSEELILSGIRADLSRDSVDAARALTYARGRVVGADRLLAFIEDPDAGTLAPIETSPGATGLGPYFDATLSDFGTREWSPRQALSLAASEIAFGQMDVSRATFDEAVASGRLGVVKDEALRSRIAYYYYDAQRSARTIDSRAEAQWYEFRRTLAEAGISPASADPGDILATLKSHPGILAELKNLRSLAFFQTIQLQVSMTEAQRLMDAIDSSPTVASDQPIR